MNPSFFNGYTDDAYLLDTTVVDKSNTFTPVIEDYEREVFLTLNNYLLCVYNPLCNDNNNVDTEVPATPIGSTPTNIKPIYVLKHNNSVILSWGRASGIITKYEIYKSTEPDVLGSLIYSGINLLHNDTTGLIDGVTYYYTPIVCNVNGCISGETTEYLHETLNDSTLSNSETVQSNENIFILNNTFEVLYKNISSYPHYTNMDNKKYIIKTFTLPEGKEIICTVDMLTPNKITTTLTGDTGSQTPMVKVTEITADKRFKTTYL